MPELPEVETVRRTLAPIIEGLCIAGVRFLSPLCADRQPDLLAARLTGRRILRLDRTGKHLIIALDQGALDIHLRMTGKLLLDAPVGPHTRAVFDLGGLTLNFDDIRQFGRLRWLDSPEALTRVGPDALEIGFDEFSRRLATRRGRIKPLLLNQEILSGLGNIYVDEALHRAGIHPLTLASRLGHVRLSRLYEAVRHVLLESVAAGGSSISDYVDARGIRGSFQERHLVYGREGAPCAACGTPVRRIVVAQRGTHLCPRCQRR